MRSTAIWTGLVAFGALAACGGGSGGASSGSDTTAGGDGGTVQKPADLAGIYMGRAIFLCDPVNIFVLVTEDSAIYYTDRFVGLHAGSVAPSGSGFTTSMTKYGREGPSSLSRAAAGPSTQYIEFLSFAPHRSIAVRWPFIVGGICMDSRASLVYQADLYENAASLAKVAGVYTINPWGVYTLTIAVNGDGQLSGSDTEGCVLNGTVTVPHPDRNHYHVTADVDSCPSQGTYVGDATLLVDSSNPAGVLWLFLRDLQADLAIQYAMPR